WSLVEVVNPTPGPVGPALAKTFGKVTNRLKQKAIFRISIVVPGHGLSAQAKQLLQPINNAGATNAEYLNQFRPAGCGAAGPKRRGGVPDERDAFVAFFVPSHRRQFPDERLDRGHCQAGPQQPAAQSRGGRVPLVTLPARPAVCQKCDSRGMTCG